jgi:hypothetical protein
MCVLEHVAHVLYDVILLFKKMFEPQFCCCCCWTDDVPSFFFFKSQRGLRRQRPFQSAAGAERRVSFPFSRSAAGILSSSGKFFKKISKRIAGLINTVAVSLIKV